jgi:hypothetical protein
MIPRPERASAPAGAREERIWFLAVLAGVLFVNVGVWRTGVPWADEVSMLGHALQIRGGASAHLYQLGYALLLSKVTTDPLVAYTILRFVASVGATLGLYFVLRSFRGLRPAAVAVACLIFAGSGLCTPRVQNAPSHLFCLAVVLPALAFVLRRPSLLSALVFVLSAFVAAQMRPEYYAPMLLVPMGVVVLKRARRRAGQTAAPVSRRGHLVMTGVALVLVIAVGFAHHQPRPSGKLSAYLLLGLGQCYAVFYQQRHPGERFSPMTEYEPLLNRVFGNPRDFGEAIANNPREFAHYLAVNTITNLAFSPRLTLSSRSRLYSSLVLLLFVAGTGLWVLELARRRRTAPTPTPLERRTLLAELLILVLFMSASSVAVVLLIPVARYEISWLPLLYLWLAWSVDRVLSRISSARLDHRLVVAAAGLVFCFPIFIGYHSDKEILDDVRASVAGLSHTPVVAGDWVTPLAVFALKDDVVVINGLDGLSVDGLKKRTYDIFVTSPNEATAFRAANEAFFRDFIAAPERFGYRLLGLRPGLVDFSVYVRAS